VDLLDTAAARVKIEQDAPPQSMVFLRSRLASAERELTARKRDIADGAVDDGGRVGELEAHMEEIKQELVELETKLAREKELVTAVKNAQAKLREAEEAERQAAVGAVQKARTELAAAQGESALVHFEVDRDAIGQVVSDWTGIPVGKMKSSSIETMLQLEDKLQERIKGQDHATAAVAEAIRMSHAGVRNPQTPIAVMLFVGPSGVGKTETALALADLLYGGERSMVTINMSEFQEKHTVSRLIGSPPGYVGYGEGGVLTEAVRHRPYTVVLLDECEKADLEVMNLFYQVFDKGMLSDGEGRVVNFRNTVVILTSNLATDLIMQMHDGGKKPGMDDVLERIRPALSKHFKPALLARMSVVPYRPMDPNILTDIAKLKLDGLARRLEDAHGVSTTFEDDLIAHLVARCTEGETGARALDHAMRGALMPNLARAILEQMAGEGVKERLSIGIGDAGFRFQFD
jgi:type VI secretion system protein VasG